MKLKGIKDILLSLVDQKVNIYSVRQELLDFLNNDLYKMMERFSLIKNQ